MDAVLEQKLREIVDRHEIWQVLVRYARGLDRLDRELVRSCYFDDATEDHGHFVGKPGDFIEWANASTVMFKHQTHGLMNHFCDLKGDDAYCETYYSFTGVADSPPHLHSVGRYIDHFQRRNGEWRIANRITLVEGTFDLDDSSRSANLPPAYRDGELQPSSRDRNDASYQRPLRPRKPR